MSESLYDYKAPDYKRLTQAELVELWKQHRNDTAGVMAADEIMRRLLPEPEIYREDVSHE